MKKIVLSILLLIALKSNVNGQQSKDKNVPFFKATEQISLPEPKLALVKKIFDAYRSSAIKISQNRALNEQERQFELAKLNLSKQRQLDSLLTFQQAELLKSYQLNRRKSNGKVTNSVEH